MEINKINQFALESGSGARGSQQTAKDEDKSIQ